MHMLDAADSPVIARIGAPHGKAGCRGTHRDEGRGWESEGEGGGVKC